MQYLLNELKNFWLILKNQKSWQRGAIVFFFLTLGDTLVQCIDSNSKIAWGHAIGRSLLETYLYLRASPVFQITPPQQLQCDKEKTDGT